MTRAIRICLLGIVLSLLVVGCGEIGAEKRDYKVINTWIQGSGCWYDSKRFILIKRDRIPAPELYETDGLYYFDVTKPIELRRIDLSPLDPQARRRIWEIKCADESVLFAVSGGLYRVKIDQPLQMLARGPENRFSPHSVSLKSNYVLVRSGKAVDPDFSLVGRPEECGIAPTNSGFEVVCWHNTYSIRRTWALSSAVLAEYQWEETIQVKDEDGQVKTIENPEAPLLGRDGKPMRRALLLFGLDHSLLRNLTDAAQGYVVFASDLRVTPGEAYAYATCRRLDSPHRGPDRVCRYRLDGKASQWEEVFVFDREGRKKTVIIEDLDVTDRGDVFFVLAGAGEGERGIWWFEPAGGTVRQLTHPPAYHRDRPPRVSPDGTRVAFSRADQGVSKLFIVETGRKAR